MMVKVNQSIKLKKAKIDKKLTLDGAVLEFSSCFKIWMV